MPYTAVLVAPCIGPLLLCPAPPAGRQPYALWFLTASCRAPFLCWLAATRAAPHTCFGRALPPIPLPFHTDRCTCCAGSRQPCRPAARLPTFFSLPVRFVSRPDHDSHTTSTGTALCPTQPSAPLTFDCPPTPKLPVPPLSSAEPCTVLQHCAARSGSLPFLIPLFSL